VQRTPFRPLWTELKGFGSGGTVAALADDSHNAPVRRLVVIALLGALLAALAAGSTDAALWLLFSKTSAQPGDLVFVRTGGNGALLAASKRGETKRWPLRVFMVSTADADSIRSTRDGRLMPLGRLTVDRRGNGRLRFATPNLPPGEYTTLIECRSCARYSNGRTLVTGGPSRPFRLSPFLRNCASEQYGELPADWSRRAVHAGPLSLYPLPAATPRRAPGKPGRFVPIKLLLVVQPGQRATLTVPKAARPFVGLLYGHGSRFGTFAPAVRVRDGLTAVTFDSCANGEYPHQHFGGGFVVSKRMCAHLEVEIPARADPFFLDVPFGATC
jgi:hypothetical protein